MVSFLPHRFYFPVLMSNSKNLSITSFWQKRYTEPNFLSYNLEFGIKFLTVWSTWPFSNWSVSIYFPLKELNFLRLKLKILIKSDKCIAAPIGEKRGNIRDRCKIEVWYVLLLFSDYKFRKVKIFSQEDKMLKLTQSNFWVLLQGGDGILKSSKVLLNFSKMHLYERSHLVFRTRWRLHS